MILELLFLHQIGDKMAAGKQNNDSRIESRQEVATYIARLKYALTKNSSKILYQESRKVDSKREDKFTNEYLIKDQFSGQDPIKILKNELNKIRIEEYICTVKDINKPDRSEMRVFGRYYDKGEVYIKIRVELCNIEQCFGVDLIFVMSFHYSTSKFSNSIFPYGINGGKG